MTVASRI